MIKKTVLVAAVLLAAGIVAANLTVARLPAMPAAEGRYIALHDREIHYVEHPGHGVPVLMLHGLPGTHRDFDTLIPRLPGLHVFTIDRPGFGWSKGGWLPYREQIDLVHDFLTNLAATPAVVVGWSFGGGLALGLARRYPQDVAKLILTAPSGGGDRSETMDLLQARYLEFSQLPVVKSIIKYTFGNVALRLSAHFGARRAFEPAPVDPAYEGRLMSVTLTPGNVAAFAREQLEYDQTMGWLDDNVSDIRVPSVEIAALGDKLVPIENARQLAQTLPGVRLVTVDGNHMIPYTHPDVVVDELARAQADLRPAA
ncbi:alpha/beta hydrolase [Mycobacterium sp.]|uniref:alpha/beta fold hydrolase n=1 Tax=Mycobacterium sp. TaxID=1785 RepID=UPI002D72F81E|nr:alpha/beta hydrolase [Mycobacterium sp.]HZA10033.1 alpha/beta hydrolase [Mycobacterium sp.]